MVKIENYEGTADTFTFPYNPLSFDGDVRSNFTDTEYSYFDNKILVSSGSIAPANLILTGHFSGSTRWTDYRNLSSHFGSSHKLKKLYFESDKFYIGVGKELKKTHSGGRTNFIDYVFNFSAVLGGVYGDTLKTEGTNAGNRSTYVFEITGMTNGSNVTLEDSFGNVITVTNTTTGQPFKYSLVKMVDSGRGIFVSEYGYVEIDGNHTRQVTNTDGFGLLRIGAGANVSTIFTSNLTSPVIKFRDGYAD